MEAFFLVHSPQQGPIEKPIVTRDTDSSSTSGATRGVPRTPPEEDASTPSLPVTNVDSDHSGDSMSRTQVPQVRIYCIMYSSVNVISLYP